MTDASLQPSGPAPKNKSLLANGLLIVLAIAAGKFLSHWLFQQPPLAIFGTSSTTSPAAEPPGLEGYGVDHPPLIPFLIHVCRAILGDSLRSIRFLPALASSLLVVQAAILAREFGGRRFAMLLSAITVVIAPQYLSNGSLLGTNCLEPNLWMGCAYFAILAIKRNDPRYWLWFGVVAGIGLQEKYSIAVFGGWHDHGPFADLVAAPCFFSIRGFPAWGARSLPDFSAQSACGIFSNHWPFVELMHNIRADGRDVVLPSASIFLSADIAGSSLPLAPIWITGLIGILLLATSKVVPCAWLVLHWLARQFSLCSTARITILLPSTRCCWAAGAVTIESAINGTGIEGRETARPQNGRQPPRLAGSPPLSSFCLPGGRAPRACGRARSFSGQVHCLHENICR